MLTGNDVGWRLAGGEPAKAAESAPIETFTKVGVIQSMSWVVVYRTRYWRKAESSATSVKF